jgi:alpha-beta hydrolase superfamily lysophospholipase
MEGSVEGMPIYCVSSLFSLPFVVTAMPWILLGWVAYRYLKPLSIKTHTTFLHEVSPGPTFMRNKQGLWLYTHAWLPPASVSPKGVVFYAHGFGGHGQRQWELAEFLSSQGFPYFVLDHQGFGRSEGDRGHVERFSDYIDDYEQFVNKVLQDHPEYADLPLFLFGSSMGGNLAIQLANKRPDMWNGVVLLAPAIMPHKASTAPWMLYAVRVLAKHLPKFIPFTSAPWRSTIDKDVVNCYVSDPLTYTFPFGMRAGWCWEMLQAMQRVTSTVRNVEWPFVIFQGTQDTVTNAEGCVLFHQQARSQDKAYRELEGWAHSLFDEPARHELYKEMLEWVVQRTGKSKS